MAKRTAKTTRSASRSRAAATKPAANRKSDDGQSKGEQQAVGTTPIEWAVAALGALVVLAVAGYMVWIGTAMDDTPPQIVVEPGVATPYEGGFLLPFRALNKGGGAAASVPVRGELLENGEPVEDSEITIDYVPGHSDRVGGLFFTRDPAALELRVRPLGYSEP